MFIYSLIFEPGIIAPFAAFGIQKRFRTATKFLHRGQVYLHDKKVDLPAFTSSYFVAMIYIYNAYDIIL